jgi:hypothetical protein
MERDARLGKLWKRRGRKGIVSTLINDGESKTVGDREEFFGDY